MSDMIWQVGSILKSAVLVLILAAATQAERPMSGAEFDAYTLGKTLTYLSAGQPYGAERYKPGHRVTWAFSGDDCVDGVWSEPEPGLICFVYDEAIETPQCWNFFHSAKGLRAVFAGEDGGSELYETEQTRVPLLCLGPEVGV
jgi:hypothetical protein